MNQYSYVDDKLLKYDDNGNLEFDGDYYYFYDYENRLNRIEDHSTDLIIRSYYDALGRRVMRQIFDDADSAPSRSDRYYYNDRWQIVRINTELADDTTFSREFIYGNGIDEPLFMYLTTIEDNVAQTTRYYYIHDNLGSVVALTNAAGAVVESYKYTPWGEPTKKRGQLPIKITID